MMRVWFVVLWFVVGLLPTLLLGGCGASSATVAPAQSEARADAKPRHKVFLWQTQSATATVHLLGSIHIASPEIYPLDARIERAFEAADVLVLEIDLDETAETEAGLAFMNRALLPKSESLDDLLDEETRVLLHLRLSELDISPEGMQMFRPWFVAMIIGMKQMEERGFTGEYGIDHHFRARAVGNKTILELETVEEQIELLTSLGAEAEIEDLKMVLQEDAAESLAELTKLWQVGDTLGILREVEDMRQRYPDVYERLLAERNHRMVEKIEEYLKTRQRYFVVAGAAHMVGPDGIVELLKARGYVVEQH